jgi:hypothetical protein
MQSVGSSLQGIRLHSMPRRQQRVCRGQLHVVRAAKVADGPRVAIVGVTGAVGQEFLRVSSRDGSGQPVFIRCCCCKPVITHLQLPIGVVDHLWWLLSFI